MDKRQRKGFVDATVDFMSHPCFRQLRTAADVGILLFEDLYRFEMPKGYTKEEVWRVLTAVRKQAAVMIPDDPEREADMWMITTSALSFDSETVELRTRVDSTVQRALRELQGSPYVTRFIERTLIHGLEVEGISVDEGRIHELYTGAAPTDSIDRLVTNYFELSSNCDRLAAREVTHGMIENLYYELIEGVNLADLPARKLVPLDPRLPPPESQVLMDLVCQRAREADDDMRFGPVLRIINITWFFRYFDVLPHVNVLVGLLLRNIIAIKWGFPVLCWLPAAFDPKSEDAVATPARQQAIFEHWSRDFGFGFDFTPYFELNVKLYLQELDKLSVSIDYLEKLNEKIGRIFASHINQRQKSILSALIREPGAILRIGPHQRAFRIAYGTARADFLSLEREGFLVREQEGRAFVFRADPLLQEKIVQLGAAAVESAEASLTGAGVVVS
ncbi:hypothetical protein VJ923_06300 [Adlercreutzia sp. R25]|uniref:Fido domain-containing protein n=1 Tax=Adlercreutzia shanghongiae TaxID=3111773 RepID=A0ABU6IZB7_9ACTN|nr:MULTISPECIES: hypothetical protein [unclassified Adlercreutzia]MEC4272764.1 hypothetical protein [Adlercreutzia sp. R25]MEC4295118.1 hypothetical protein [Adlercreutzia sp. R22]